MRILTLASLTALLVLPALKASPNAAAIQRLEAYPPSLALTGPEDAHRLLVTGWTEAGARVDLTSKARLEAPAGLLRLDADGYFSPIQNGEGAITIQAEGLEAKVPVSVKDFEKVLPVSFVRDVEPIINKIGCTGGTCHGAAKGKNGFRLSLRGYDPEFDYTSLVDDLSGRRFNRADPAQSLMLLKPTQGVPHVGGFLFGTDSRFYQTLYRWISEGLRTDAGKVTRVSRIEVVPNDVIAADAGASQQLLVLAHYDDGKTRDVTRDSFFTSSVFTVAEVTPAGQVTALRRGETPIIVRYEGQFATATITVLGDRTNYAWVEITENNHVDTLINKKLKKIKALPSDLATEDVFIRRVYLDVIGVSPTPEEVRQYLAEGKSESPEKSSSSYPDLKARRERLVDKLLEREEYVDHWALKWSDLLQANRKYLGDKGVWAFRNWIKESVAKNLPFDQFARTLLTGTGGTYSHPESSFYRI